MARLTDGVANALLDAVTAMMSDGWLDIYAGDVRVASLRLGNPAFEKATDRVARARALTPDKKARATGKPTRYVLVTADRATVLQEGTAGGPGSGAELEISAVMIVEGAEVKIDSYVLRMK
jgi:hypothetical protein